MDDERLLGQILTVDQLPLKVGELLAPEERELEGAFLLSRVARDTEPMEAAAISATAPIDQQRRHAMTLVIGIAIGIALALIGRALLVRAVVAKLRRDVSRLGAGDYGPLLAGYHDQAVLHFTEGPHRWSGTHRGRAAIENFLREFTNAGLTGEVKALWISGWPWSTQMLVRFNDEAHAPDGERIYENRTVLWVRSRWGKIIEQRDFYEDTRRIPVFDQRLRELGVEPVADVD